MTYKTKITIEGLLKMPINPTETFQQLRPNTDRYWSWGVSKRINLMNKALILKVSGHLFKGYVVIALDYNDTYNVHLVTTHGNISKSIENVYCDELAEVIDNHIERIPEYKEGVSIMKLTVQTF
jgi:hypothetical protein